MKKITFKSLLSFALVGACFSGFSQQARQIKKGTSFELTDGNQQHFNETGIVRCASVEYENKLRKLNPNRLNNQQFENWIAPKITEYKQRSVSGKMAITTIPIIFHVFSDCAGTDNVSPALIQAQLDQLNIDYADLAGSSDPDSADTEVRFAFAQVDPSGNILHEPGINRVSAYGGGPFTDTYVDGTLKPATSWDPNNYMNIWVANLSGGLLGWAQFPDSSGLGGLNASGGNANTDGVVIGSATVGSIAMPNPAGGNYPAGRTLTHEVGHWLGLRHLWGDGNCSVDDFVTDTLNCDDQYYAGNGTGGCIAPTQCGNVREIENYMDYSDDSCMNEFTAGQKARMQTVLSLSPRRNTLGASTVDNPANPVLFFDACTAISSVVEGSACGFQDVTFQIGKSKISTGAETVTFSNSGTATNNVDYAIQTPSLSFAAGSTTKQNFTVRVFEDGFVEGDETIVLDLNVATGGNSIAAVLAKQITITITDDDIVRSLSSNTENYNEDFNDQDISDWTLSDLDTAQAPDGRNWGDQFEVTDAGGTAVSSVSMISRSWIGGGVGAISPNNWAVTPVIDLSGSAGAVSVELSWKVACAAAAWDQEQYSVYVATSSNVATLQASPVNFNETYNDPADAGTVYTRTLDLSSIANGAGANTVYIGFRHHDSNDQDWIGIDDVKITTVRNADVQQTINAADQVFIAGNGTAYASDNATDNAMADITNNNTVNYGCVSTNVSRAADFGANAAVMYQVAGIANYVMARTVTITPTTVQAAGNTTVKFYFYEDELQDWAAQTGNAEGDLTVIKDNGSTSESVAATLGNFGIFRTIEATFATGINGTYYFGKQEAILGIAENQFNSFNLYPNPSSDGIFNLSVSTTDDARVKLFDIRGRNVYSELHTNNSDVFKTTLDFSKLASGVYMLDVESDFKRAVKKIVIQ